MNKKSAVRNYGIDLLRIAAMFMVLLLHVLGQGGILNNLVSTPLNFCLNIEWLGYWKQLLIVLLIVMLSLLDTIITE